MIAVVTCARLTAFLFPRLEGFVITIDRGGVRFGDFGMERGGVLRMGAGAIDRTSAYLVDLIRLGGYFVVTCARFGFLLLDQVGL